MNKKLLLNLLLQALLLCCSCSFAHAQNAFQWVNGGGGNGGQINSDIQQDARLITTDNRGHLYSFGVVNKGNVHVDTFLRNGTYNNQGDLLLCSWSCNGKLRWAKTMGDIYQESPFAVASDNNGNVYVCGEGGRINGSVSGTFKIGDSLVSIPSSTTGSGIFIAKFDSTGRMKWLKFPGTANNVNVVTLNEVRRMQIDASGKLMVYAQMASLPNDLFEGQALAAGGFFNLYRYRIDTATGAVSNLVRMQGITGGAGIYSRLQVSAIEADPFGNTYAIMSGDTVTMLGITAYANSNRSDFLIASFDNTGNPRWVKKVDFLYNNVGPLPPQLGLHTIQYLNNNLYLAGELSKNYNYYGNTLATPNLDSNEHAGILLNLNAANGNFNNYKTIGSVASGVGASSLGVAITAITVKQTTGELAMTGLSTYKIILNGIDTMKPLLGAPVIIYNPTTQIMSGGKLGFTGTNGYVSGTSIVSDNLGNLYVGGKYEVFTLSANTASLPFYGGDYNFFVARYGQPNGCLSCTTTPKPTITAYSRAGQTVTVKGTNPVNTADSLVWVWGDGSTTRNTAANVPVLHTYSSQQVYSLCLRSYSTCGNADTCMSLSTLSVNGLEKISGIRLFPNPASTSFMIANETGLALAYQIYDVYGRRVAQGNVKQKQELVDISLLSTGSYLVQCMLSNGNTAAQLLRVVH